VRPRDAACIEDLLTIRTRMGVAMDRHALFTNPRACFVHGNPVFSSLSKF
jgi:hypothetical protein